MTLRCNAANSIESENLSVASFPMRNGGLRRTKVARGEARPNAFRITLEGRRPDRVAAADPRGAHLGQRGDQPQDTAGRQGVAQTALPAWPAV